MKKINLLIQAQFEKMEATGKLFRSSISGQRVWETYINGFKPEDNPVFRDPNSTTHNCNLCNNFIRRYGNIVALDENLELMSIWDVIPESGYVSSFEKMSNLLKNAPIGDVFFETFAELNSLPYESITKTQPVFKLGIDKNIKRYTKEEAEKYGVVKPNEIRTFHHLYVSLSNKFVKKGSESIESITGKHRDDMSVFERTMREIPLDTLLLVVDLINQNSLLNGQTYLEKIKKIIKFKKEYNKVPESKKLAWCWVNSYDNIYARFRNELIGVLCTELAEGAELNQACITWNKRVDPANYMKAVAPITKTQIKLAETFVTENGYVESFNRRAAVIEDIKANEILHFNAGDGVIPSVSIFDTLKTTSTRHKRSELENVEEVSIEKFMSDILPTCTKVELFLENRHEGNLVTLTTSNDKESKKLFKWDNNFSWTYKGNLAGKSMIKDAVKSKGGNINGVLRFSIMWAENDPSDNSDLDAWAVEPNGNRIGYSTGYRKDRGGNKTNMSGILDVDITSPSDFNHENIVENIVWDNKSKMKPGKYHFFVNPYSPRNSKGFTAEIEFNGEIHQFNYPKPVISNVIVADVFLDEYGNFTIKPALESSIGTKEIYGLQTNEFHNVNLVCLSPNHWGENKTGNKHYFFMLEKCHTLEPIRSFHTENLKPELAEHRKVLDILGETTKITPTAKQLSGVGFNATVKDYVILKLSGNFKRMLKITF